MPYDICGLGTLATDVLMMLDTLPQKDSFCLVRHTEMQPGGSGTNTIVQAARLGSCCAYLGTVGDDAEGRVVICSLKEEGVDASHVYIRPGERTTRTEIAVDAQGNKCIFLIMGDAFFKLRLNQKGRTLLHEAKVFFTDLLPGWAAMSALREAFYNEQKIAVSLEVGVSLFAEMGVTADQIRESLRIADLVVPCRDAVRELTGTDDPFEAAKKMRPYCRGIIVYTRGKKGSVAFLPDGRIVETPACPVKAVDTTGAGDSFMGALMHAYLVKEKPIEEALRFAASCAALTCTGVGARYYPPQGYPNLETI